MNKPLLSFEDLLREQFSKHPAMQIQDIVKLSYQAAYGAEHLLSDMDAAYRYFIQEFESTAPAETELYENISPDFARVNIAAWKQRGLPARWLFEMFKASVAPADNGRERLLENLKRAETLLPCAKISKVAWLEYITEYEKRSMPAVHHSEQYRRAEKPAYRLVHRRLLRLLPGLERLSTVQTYPCVIAIDGRAGSGKSTLASELAQILDAGLVHMDDFFLPPELRTAERLSAPGGNVHYERFSEEVLPKLHSSAAFDYNVFSCSLMKLDGVRTVKASDYRIVEGSYSMHPELGDYAALKVFSTVEPEEQLRRVRLRDGERAAEMFVSRWIPMEEKYFRHFDIAEKGDIII